VNHYLLYIEHDGPTALNAIKPVSEIGMVNMQLFTVKSEKDGAELVSMMDNAVGGLKQYLIANVNVGKYGYRGEGRLSFAANLLR
jgi:hypothetical protein